MFYREAGQFKTTYAADQAIFPIRAGPHRLRHRPVSFAFVGVPLFAGRASSLYRGADPGPDLLARRDRAQHPDRLLRPALARHRRLHGGRRLCLLQAHDCVLPDVNIIVWILAVGLCSAPRSACCSACRRCASRASISRSRRSPRSSSSSGASSRVKWFTNYNVIRRDRGAARSSCSASRSPARAQRR